MPSFVDIVNEIKLTVAWLANKVKRLNVTPAKDYANDTAAAAGGVPIGGLYHSSGAVKIRLT